MLVLHYKNMHFFLKYQYLSVYKSIYKAHSVGFESGVKWEAAKKREEGKPINQLLFAFEFIKVLTIYLATKYCIQYL